MAIEQIWELFGNKLIKLRKIIFREGFAFYDQLIMSQLL